MKENEFFREHGLENAKKLLSITSRMNMSGLVFATLKDGGNLDFEVEELKRLIESHDFVENIGGIHYAKYCLDLAKQNGFVNYVDKSQYEQEFYLHGDSSPKTTHDVYRISYDELKQAIADVESCR